MVWTAPKIFTVGYLVTHNDMNTYLRDNQNYLYNIPRVKTTHSVAYNLANLGGNMSHNTEVYDTDTMFTPTSHECSINRSGAWHFGSSIGNAVVANSGTRELYVFSVNENGFIHHMGLPQTGTQIIAWAIFGQYVLTDTDTLRFTYWHNHGSTLTGIKDTLAQPVFWATWVGA